MLVSVTAVVGVFAGVAGFALGVPSGHARASTSSTSRDVAPPTPQRNPTPTRLGLPARPTPTQTATVPSQPVDALAAGDCLQTYSSKSADAYPVVDCGSPHLAQMLSKGELPQSSGVAYPGEQALNAQIDDLCEQHLNWDWVRVWNEDVQVDLRYPDTATLWASGNRIYYCFVYTYSRHELTGSAVATG